jgi:putative inorganic carbon (HCO3(-)) transporter
MPRNSRSRFLFAAWLALVVWAPVPLGSNRPWAWAILELWVFLLSLWWLAAHMRGSVAPSPVLAKAWPMLACGALWLAYVCFQLVPLPPGLLELLSPQSARWHALAVAPAPPGWAPLTLDWYMTLDGAVKTAAYLCFFALALAFADRRERIVAAAYALILSGFAQALYGGLAALSGGVGEAAHGSFVNRNHYAAYLVMCLSIGIGVLIANLTGDKARTWRQFLRDALEWILSPSMRLRLALAVMVIALVLTRSRMGNSSFFIALLVAGAVGLALSRRATRSMVILIASLIVIDIAIVGTYFGVQQVVERIEQTTTQTEDRDDVASYVIDEIKDFPAFGAGLGSFQVVFPGYRGEDIATFFTHAHNDYLQFLAEAGVVGTGLLALMVLMSLVVALRAQYERRDPLMRGLSFGALMAIVALMIHSSVDFNLQIPANAMTFMLVLAFAWISLYYERGARDAKNGDRARA